MKANIGHLESAAGVAGLIKLVLALQHEQLPPHLHLKKLNPYIAWHELPIDIPTQLIPWPSHNGRRVGAVSSFGFSGTNAHVIIEEAPDAERTSDGQQPQPTSQPGAGSSAVPVLISARQPGALRQQAVRWAQWLHEHPLVPWVSYAGLPDSPFYARSQKYLPQGPGSIFTFGIKGGRAAGRRFIEAVKLHSHLANVGDAKSLVIHPGSTTHQQLTDEEQVAAGLSPDMIRISVGLENLDDILWDLDQALTASQKDN